MVRVLELHGSAVVESPINAIDLADAAVLEPEHGVYLVARTYRGGLEFLLDEHFDRIERSAQTLGRSLTVPRPAVRKILARMLRESGYRDGKFRVTAALTTPVWYRISMEEAREVPSDLLRDGVTCTIWEGAARDNAAVKSTAWIHARREARADGVYEQILTDTEGRIREGGSSNIYLVLNGELWTAGRGVLEGIARRIVLDVARRTLPVRLDALSVDRLGEVSEAFLSSATRGVVPIRAIDAVTFPHAPGPFTSAITAAYEHRLTELLRPLAER